MSDLNAWTNPLYSAEQRLDFAIGEIERLSRENIGALTRVSVNAVVHQLTVNKLQTEIGALSLFNKLGQKLVKRIQDAPAEGDNKDDVELRLMAIIAERDALKLKAQKPNEALALLYELHCVVKGECPRLFDEDSDGYGMLDLKIERFLAEARDQL